MKKVLYFIFMITALLAVNSGLASAESGNVSSFNFEDADKRAVVDFSSEFYTADGGMIDNKNISDIRLTGSEFTTFVTGSGGAGTFAPNSNNWDSGADTKYWSTSFSTLGYYDLTLSSKQYGSATGPRDFKVQWSLDGLFWEDVIGSEILVATNWTGALNDHPLTDDLDNREIVHLRWIMTSDVSINGGVVGSGGTSRIDDIMIKGKLTDLSSWDFEDGAKRGVVDFFSIFYTADEGIPPNKDISSIRLIGPAFTGFVNGSGGAGTNAPNSNNWQSGMDLKSWQIDISTRGYKDLRLFSKQNSSGTGPRDFKVQWSLDSLSWNDVDGSALTVATNWLSGVLDDLSLPIDIEDQDNVYLRWIMTSNTNVDGGTVGSAGTNRIDDVFVGGRKVPYDLSYSAGANGSLIGNTNQVVYYQNNASSVYALADAGYYFLEWSDGITDNPRRDLSVDNDINVTAEFVVNTSFENCGDVVGYDGHGYKTVQIGDQCWFSENLKYLPSVVPPTTGSDSVPYYYVYDYLGSNVDEAKLTSNYLDYGVLYNVSSAVLACPTDFRLPTDNDFKKLEMFLGLSQAEADDVTWRGTNEGDKMKSDTLWNGTNESDFGALPAGFRSTMNNFNFLGSNSYFWTSGEEDVNFWSRGLSSAESRINRFFYAPSHGFSVRCVLNTHILDYSAGANGSIVGIIPQIVLHGTDGSPVEALADYGYHFVDWSDGVVDNPRTDLNVTNDITVTANFAINQYTLTYTAGANGSVSGTAIQTVEHGEDGSPVNAVANSGYTFSGWSDGLTNNPRTDLNVTSNITVSANFARSSGGGGGGTPFLSVLFETDSQQPIPEDDDEEYDDVHFVADEEYDDGEIPPFIDIKNHWARENIELLYSLDYIQGFEDGSFKPDSLLLRAEASKLIALWMEKYIVDSDCDESYYLDVSCDDWYGKYIGFLSSRNVLSGYDSGLFLPENNITRAEALKMIIYAKGIQGSSYEGIVNPFVDVDGSAWYYNVVMIGYNLSIIQGFEESGVRSFKPDNYITRAEFVKIFKELFL